VFSLARAFAGHAMIELRARRDLHGPARRASREVELVEYTEAQERVSTSIWLASLGWDGSDPVRKEN
jgi:hypothetical protein